MHISTLYVYERVDVPDDCGFQEMWVCAARTLRESCGNVTHAAGEREMRCNAGEFDVRAPDAHAQ